MQKFPHFILGLLVVLSSSFVFANEGITKKSIDVLEHNKKVGFVTVLTPVEVISKNKVKIIGYRLEDYPQMIVRDTKRREVYVEFDDDKEDFARHVFKVIKSFEDDYGEVWQQVEGTIHIDTSAVSSNAKALNNKAKETYAQTCSMCHHLPAPDAYTVNQWPQQIEMMMEQIPLDKPTKSLITKYLQQHAADSK